MSENEDSKIITASNLEDDEFVLEQKVLSLGKEYFIKDSKRKKVGYCLKKPMKIKKEFSVFEDENKEKELFRVKQKNFLDMSGLYVVTDPESNIIGYLERNWLKGAILDEWIIRDPEKKKIGKIVDETFVRRALRFKGLKKIPYRYNIYQDESKIGVSKKRLSILRNMYKLQIRDNSSNSIDTRLLLAMTILLDEVEEKFRKIQR